MTRACVMAAVLVAGCNLGRDANSPEPSPARPAESLSRPEAPAPHAAKSIVEVTPAAAAEIRRHLAEVPEAGGCYLRVRVVPGGCQGFLHKLDLDPVTSAADHTFEANGVKVVVAARQVALIRGTTVDFGEDKGQRGFKVRNPNFEGPAAKWSLEELTTRPVEE